MDWQLIVKVVGFIVFLLFFSIFYGAFKSLRKSTRKIFWYDTLANIIRFLPFLTVGVFLFVVLSDSEKLVYIMFIIMVHSFNFYVLQENKRDFVPYQFHIRIKQEVLQKIGNVEKLDPAIVDGLNFTVLSDFVYCHNKNVFLPKLEFKMAVFVDEKIGKEELSVYQNAFSGGLIFQIFKYDKKLIEIAKASLPLEIIYYFKEDVFSKLRKKVIRKLLKKQKWHQIEDQYEHFLHFEHQYFSVFIDRYPEQSLRI